MGETLWQRKNYMNTFDELKERRKDFKKFDDVSTKDRMDAMLIDADEKLK
jgi:hypothetical protein